MKKLLSLLALSSMACAFGEASPTTDDNSKKAPATAPAAKDPASQPQPTAVMRKSVTIAAVGDVLPHGPVRASADRHNLLKDGKSINHNGYDSLFSLAKVGFADADIGFANLETPIAPKNDKGTRPFVFNAPTDLLDGLKYFDADIVSNANNHAYDQGRAAFAETMDNLEAHDLLGVGVGRSRLDALSPRIIEKNGLKICFMGQARILNADLNPKSDQEPQLVYVPYGKDGKAAKEKVIVAIKEAKKGCDFLLMSIHWGIEYDTVPNGDDRLWAKEQLEAGVDGILGHHPHVLQPLEEYTTKDGRKTFVAFSMGNFISNQTKAYPKGKPPEKMGNTRDSMILRVTVKPREDNQTGPQGVLDQVGYYPAWTDREPRPDEGGAAAPAIIRAIVIDQEVADAKAALKAFEGKTDLTPEEQAAKRMWEGRISEFSTRRKEVARVVGEKYVLPLPESK